MKEQNPSMEIDVLLLLKKLWSKKFLITLVAVFFATIALLVSLFLIKPTYTSTTSFYVGNQKAAAENALTAQDLQAGSYLVKDYKEIITTKDVSQQVIDEEKLTMSAEELLEKMTVDIPVDTRIISINVEDGDPREAARIANALRVVSSEKIKAVTKVDNVEEVDPAEAPTEPSSPNIKRNVALGFLIGGFLAVATILVREVLDDRIKRPEDIEEVLGLPLIGVVPNTDKLK